MFWFFPPIYKLQKQRTLVCNHTKILLSLTRLGSIRFPPVYDLFSCSTIKAQQTVLLEFKCIGVSLRVIKSVWLNNRPNKFNKPVFQLSKKLPAQKKSLCKFEKSQIALIRHERLPAFVRTQ